jgi:hypothetical protein
VDQPWSAASQVSASADTRVPGARRTVSSVLRARSAAAREAAVLETSRTSPSKSRNFTRALTRPLGMISNKIVPLVVPVRERCRSAPPVVDHADTVPTVVGISVCRV